jgi:23S rRNA (uracil1939-C5)-methyltransferase
MTTPATPLCPHFGPCGGCQLQHLPYETQLAQKATQLRTLLGPATPEVHLHPSPPYAYRNRIRLSLAQLDGTLHAGYIHSSTPGDTTLSILPITQCPISAPTLWRATEAFLALLNQTPTPWLRTPGVLPDQLELFTTADESGLQLTLSLRTAAKSLPNQLTAAFPHLCEDLRIQMPQLTGAGITLLPPASRDRSRRAEPTHPGPTWGRPGLQYPIGEQTYWVPRTAFFQVNRFLLPEMLALVATHAEACPEKSLAWDLYAGVGLFSRALARTFEQVAAVEIAEPAFAALASTKLANLRAIQATTLNFLLANVIQRDRPALIVLDPPRSGAGPEVCALLNRIGAPTLVYVSCSPQTLPADLATLTGGGYTLAAVHLFDLFPQTAHLETIAILTR